MADLPTEVARINALTTNARTTWFALLGVLVFVGITLMGVEHIDFYGVNRATKLPLVDVEVPTRLFFIAAPILTFAIYGYFHLYLIRLWDALGAADAFVKRTPLGDAITPWLVSDAALHLRNKKREDRCTTPRSLEGAAMVLNVALAWGFGLMILFALWMTSMAARSPDMSLVAGLMLIAAGWVGLASWLVMRRRMRGLSVTDKRPLWAWAALGLGGATAIVFVAAISIERTSGMLGLYPRAAAAEAAIGTWLARNDPPEADDAFDFPENFWSLGLLTLGPVNLVGEALVEKPDNWLPHDVARSEFRPKWCEREAVDCQNMSAQQADAFQAEWVTRRSAQIDALGKPEVNHVNPTQYREMNADLRAFVRANGLDLRKADMRGAFLPGMNLVAADLNGAKLDGAVLESADLFEAQMQQANLSAAQMERANLNSAQMDEAILNAAQMDGADLRFAHVKGANLVDSHLTRSDLRGTHMQGADLSFASLVAADLRSAQMEGADLSFAAMDGANLGGAQMQDVNLSGVRLVETNLFLTQLEGANLRYSRILGSTEHNAALGYANLSATINYGGAMRFAKMTNALWDDKTDFRNAFMDATVLRSAEFETRMGNPCQWVDEALDDQEFLSVWHWWVKKTEVPRFLMPSDLRSVPLPTPERLAELGLTNCEPGQPFGPMPTTD